MKVKKDNEQERTLWIKHATFIDIFLFKAADGNSENVTRLLALDNLSRLSWGE